MNGPAIPHSQRLVVVVGPSGAGKDSVLRAWRDRLALSDVTHDVHFAQRLITRPPDSNEAHESVDEAMFGTLRMLHELATWWHAHGLLYGVRWHELATLARGGWVVMNGSRAHLPTLRRQAPRLHAVQISASPELRSQRLAARGREGTVEVERRLARDANTPVDLQLDNNGALADAVGALHTWWAALPRR
jgi:ribose 1,5-bisphosphokinase